MKKFVPAMVALLALPNLASAQDTFGKNTQISGWGFVRHESKKDADYDNDAKDKTDFTSTRINVNLKSDLADNYGYIYFSPQFSKISGQNEATPVAGGATTSTPTSGGLSDSRLDVHEAYFAVKPTQDDKLFVFVGRQELAYGDHLIMGSVPWHRIGRAFDGAKVRYKLNDAFTLDAFGAKLQENTPTANSANTVGQDTNFAGAYLSGNFGDSVKAADFYALKRDNQGAGSFKDTTAYGVRFKSPVANTAIDYRAEGTLEHARLAGNTGSKNGEYQVNAEVGYTFNYLTSRFAFEYFDSTKNFDQLFPTAHKFLGYADQFSRRNIKGYVAHFSTKPYDKVSFLADYHIFQRHSNKDAAYNFGGNAIGTGAGSSRDIGNELDLTVAYDFTKTLQVSAGYALVNPGKYIKDQNSDKTNATNWSYFQLLARF